MRDHVVKMFLDVYKRQVLGYDTKTEGAAVWYIPRNGNENERGKIGRASCRERV